MATMYPRRSSCASRSRASVPVETHGQTVQLDFVAPVTCRSGSATSRRGAGRLRFRDPSP